MAVHHLFGKVELPLSRVEEKQSFQAYEGKWQDYGNLRHRSPSTPHTEDTHKKKTGHSYLNNYQ
jgi:hypothetical protein